MGFEGNILAFADFGKLGKEVLGERYVHSEEFTNDIGSVHDYKGDKLPQGLPRDGHPPLQRPSVRDGSVRPLR
ncbi:hypothetical protein ACFW5I_27460 [Streptomyces sp. NPDC058818]|uniref:hypothetical protein n=1 Tax=Streptomyces sp. NPDC058818 TaxID=3346640 RepID=UPI00368818F1